MSVNAVSQRSIAVVLLALFLGMSFSPLSELWIEEAEAAEVARHTYEFSERGKHEFVDVSHGPPVAGSIQLTRISKKEE